MTSSLRLRSLRRVVAGRHVSHSAVVAAKCAAGDRGNLDACVPPSKRRRLEAPAPAPAVLPVVDASEVASHRRGEAILRALWSGHLPSGVTPFGEVAATAPAELVDAVRRGAAEVQQLLCQHDLGPSLDARVITWGSGGDAGAYGADAAVDEFFRGLFEHIRAQAEACLQLPVQLTKQGLFHGHIYWYPRAAAADALPGAPAGGELAIVFHAREFPRDGADARGRGASFRMAQPGFRQRNFLYLMSSGRMWIIDPSGRNAALLLGRALAGMVPRNQDPRRLATVDGAAFHLRGPCLPDVNLLPIDLDQPDGTARVLFFKPFLTPD